MKKRCMAAILAAILMVGTLAGCNSQEPAETQAVTEAQTEAAKVAETTKAAETAATEATPEGKKVLTVGINQKADIADYDNNKLTLWFEDQLNCDIQFVYFSMDIAEAKQQISLMASAGEKFPDVFYGFLSFKDTTFINQLGEDGYLMDLTDLITEKAPNFNDQLGKMSDSLRARVMTNITDPTDGKIYCLPYVADTLAWDNIQSLNFINQKWLDQAGLSVPTTVDELHDVLKAFVENDPNGNGLGDEVGMFGENSTIDTVQYLINAYVYFDNQFPLNAENGKLWVPYTSDEYREAMKTLKQFTEEGLISSQNFTQSRDSSEQWPDIKALDSREDGTSLIGIIGGHPSNVFEANAQSFYDYVPVTALQDETGKGGYLVVRPSEIRYPALISADCEDVDLAMQFLDLCFADDTVATLRHGYKGENWDYADLSADRDTCNIKILDDGQAFFDGVTTWGRNTASVQTNYNYMSNGEVDDPWQQNLQDLKKEYEKQITGRKVPAEIVTDISYNGEEVEEISEYKTLLQDYVQQARAEFATGVKDPANDADWNEYLDKLEAIGLSRYLEIAQAAYSRMK